MALKKKAFFPPFVNDIYIMLTEKCPMRCEYCYIRHREDGGSITRETIDKLMEKVTGRPRIIFFGGEPLLKINHMKWFIGKYGDRCSAFQTVTSAAVNFDQFYEEVYKPNAHKFDLQMSWDGTAGTRKLAGGVNNSLKVYSRIDFLLKENALFQVRSVINDTNVDELYDLYEEFRHISGQHENFCADMTLAHQEQYDKSFPRKLKAGLEQILESIRTEIDEGRKPYIQQWILNCLSASLNHDPIMGCNVGTEIIVRPNGDIYPCTMLSQLGDRFRMGNVNDPMLDTSVIGELIRQPAECSGCGFRDRCMGGCRYEKMMRTGDLYIVNPCYCEQAVVIIPVVEKWLRSLDDEERKSVYAHVAQYIKWKACASSIHHNQALEFRAKEVTYA